MTITGNGFKDSTTVTIGDKPCDIVGMNYDLITCTVPANVRTNLKNALFNNFQFYRFHINELKIKKKISKSRHASYCEIYLYLELQRQQAFDVVVAIDGEAVTPSKRYRYSSRNTPMITSVSTSTASASGKSAITRFIVVEEIFDKNSSIQ